ncbi:MAG: tetratricopeptide repeat protein [Deltaproteobacteria bacterium]|nr:tetratricopeptide repeat protein [Deltaproteobacteria bacterium]
MSLGRAPVVAAALLAGAAATGCQDLRARQLLKSGNDYYRKGEYQLAVESYKKAEAIRPDIVQVHLHQAYAGLSLFVPGDTSPPNQQVAKDAIDAFNRYLKLRPADEKIRQIMIQTLIDSGRYDDALNFFKAKLAENPKDLEAIKALGVISSKAGRFEDGLGWYERRAQVTPNDPEAFYAIGTLCWERLYQRSDKAGEERIKLADRGIAALKHAVELKPKYVEAITYINLLYRERALGQGDEEERAKDLEQARYFHQTALGLRGLATQPASQPASGPASAPAADQKGAKGAKGAKGMKGAKGAKGTTGPPRREQGQ